ncbi:MAG TPA: hypothetical protein VGC65_01685 [Bacteroidia bacterium]|jgi:hypothetical protein
MRRELELMKTIENYLKGNLSAADKITFENKIKANPELQKEVELQKQLLEGIERAGLKQSAKQSLKKHRFNKNLRNWGLTGLAVAILTVSAIVLYNSVIKKNAKENAPQELPELNEQGDKLWSDADKFLELQNFELDAEKDTVIETKDGIVIAIPANSFLDASGKPAKGKIDLEVKEALHAADIMKAGLSTRSGDKLLETGGMFYINARQDGASLTIDTKNPLYAEIPTNEVKPGMQLFEGKRLPDGTIDWVNPKPIQKDLIPVDILSLDFYPPAYLDSLKSWGYNNKDKRFTDSLYYSFAAYFPDEHSARAKATADSIAAVAEASAAMVAAEMQVASDRGASKKEMAALEKKYAALNYKEKSLYPEGSLSEQLGNDSSFGVHGINPARVKAIWSDKFQNTLLATREFEERLPYIHRTCNESVLDMYVNNLDKNLCTIDSMVAQPRGNSESDGYISGYPEFLKFAARGDGKVKNGNTNVRLLKAYYEQKAKIYSEAISKTVNEFRNKQLKKDVDAAQKKMENANNESLRKSDNLMTEFNLNVTEAYRQLGYKKSTPAPMSVAAYGVAIQTTGWNNVDKYVMESTLARTTLDYTDPQSGKKAVINYEPLTISITDVKSYDRVLVYLLPDELNSFMRVEKKNEAFEEKLNELMSYKMVCIAYKGEESFYFSQDNVKPGTLTISLIKTTNADITNNVNKLGKLSQVKAMNDDLNYMAFEKEEAKRQVMLAAINELTNKVRPVIFPCMAAATAPVADSLAHFQ